MKSKNNKEKSHVIQFIVQFVPQNSRAERRDTCDELYLEEEDSHHTLQ